MMQLDEKYNFMTQGPGHVSRKHDRDKLIVFERGGLLWIFNFHPTQVNRSLILLCEYNVHSSDASSLPLSVCLSLSVSLSVCLSLCLSLSLSVPPPPPPPHTLYRVSQTTGWEWTSVASIVWPWTVMPKSSMVMAALTTMLTTTQTKETGMEGLTHSWSTFPPG